MAWANDYYVESTHEITMNICQMNLFVHFAAIVIWPTVAT